MKMKKWVLLVLVVAGIMSVGQAQIKIGNRMINTKKSIECCFECGIGNYFVG